MADRTVHLELPDLIATDRLGRTLGEMLRSGDRILLFGGLGAGKTTLVQAIGRGAGVPPSGCISSPTFNLLHEYQARLPLYHLDLYRLASEEEIEELGFLDYLYGQGAALVEWPDRLGRLKPDSCLEAELSVVGDMGRRVRLTALGKQWEERLEEIAAAMAP